MTGIFGLISAGSILYFSLVCVLAVTPPESEDVGPSSARHEIVARIAEQRIVAHPTINRVITLKAAEIIVFNGTHETPHAMHTEPKYPLR